MGFLVALKGEPTLHRPMYNDVGSNGEARNVECRSECGSTFRMHSRNYRKIHPISLILHTVC